ncbi:MAG: adenylosuccinate lyase [Herpetosiphon sp.]
MADLASLSPLDGRYRADIEPLIPFFSESALYRARVQIEVEYLIFLTRTRHFAWAQPLPVADQARLRQLYRYWSPDYAAAIAAWDTRVNHDVKAVEYWLREQLEAFGLEAWQEMIHWALTSEDVNNLAYALLIREARNEVMLPALRAIYTRLRNLALEEAATPMLARTHGQPATPTTLGKEANVFAHRLHGAIASLQAIKLTAKLNGATGTYGAHLAGAPAIDWLTFSRGFIRQLELEPALVTTQIEPHDTLAELCDALRRANVILLDLDMDVWRYISDGYFVQRPVAAEVGSSTMPHKINPIDFENSEGNLHLANALLEVLARKLPISRLQRDLSDSTMLRNVGVAFGYSLVAFNRTLRGLNKLVVDRERLQADLLEHPEVLAEAIQTVLRREGYPEPYETLKKVTRGQVPTLQLLQTFINTLDIGVAVRQELLALRPENYIGLAQMLAELAPM